MLAALLIASNSPRSDAGQGPILDPSTVKAQVKLMWDSLASMEIVSEESVASADGRIDRTKSIHIYKIKYSSDGRWASEMDSPSAGGRRFHVARFQGGGRLHEVAYDGDRMTIIREAYLDADAGRYQGMPGILMTLLMPGDKSVLDHLEAGATLEIEVGPRGERSVILATKYRGHPLRMTLDPDHDWLVSSVHLGSGRGVTCRVTRFDRDNGRWYPAEGVQERPDGPATNSPTLRAFAATTFRVNRPIPDAAFASPKPQEGTNIQDDIKKKITLYTERPGVNRPTMPPDPSPSRGAPLVAGPRPSRAPFYVGLGAASALLLIWAVIRHRRQ